MQKPTTPLTAVSLALLAVALSFPSSAPVGADTTQDTGASEARLGPAGTELPGFDLNEELRFLVRSNDAAADHRDADDPGHLPVSITAYGLCFSHAVPAVWPNRHGPWTTTPRLPEGIETAEDLTPNPPANEPDAERPLYAVLHTLDTAEFTEPTDITVSLFDADGAVVAEATRTIVFKGWGWSTPRGLTSHDAPRVQMQSWLLDFGTSAEWSRVTRFEVVISDLAPLDEPEPLPAVDIEDAPAERDPVRAWAEGSDRAFQLDELAGSIERMDREMNEGRAVLEKVLADPSLVEPRGLINIVNRLHRIEQLRRDFADRYLGYMLSC